MFDQRVIGMILVCAAGTFLTRAIPFLIFGRKETLSKRVLFLSTKLPLAIMLLLIMYCIRSTAFLAYPYGIPEIGSILLVALLHAWKRNMLLSIAAGTFCYMICIQFIFI